MFNRCLMWAVAVNASLIVAGQAIAAAETKVQDPRTTSVSRVKPQTLAIQQNRDIEVVRDLNTVIAAPVAAEMTIAEQQAVTELAQEVLGLRNAREYQRLLRERLSEVRNALAQNVGDKSLQAEVRSLEERLETTSEMSEMMQMRLQQMLQKQQQTSQLMSNILKKQQDTTRAIINNIK